MEQPKMYDSTQRKRFCDSCSKEIAEFDREIQITEYIEMKGWTSPFSFCSWACVSAFSLPKHTQE